MSQALKGIACVFILMGHWGQRKFDIDMPWGISKVVWQTTATTALVWFMCKRPNSGSLWIWHFEK